MGKVVKTAQQANANWVAAMQSPQASANYKAGIQRYTGNPMQQAASDAAEQLFLNRVTASVTSGRRKAKLMSLSRESWSGPALSIGASQLSIGAQKGAPKQLAFATKWQPIWQQASDAANAIPKGGSANAKARVNAVIDVFMQAAGTA